jgi:hypothetical protein
MVFQAVRVAQLWDSCYASSPAESGKPLSRSTGAFHRLEPPWFLEQRSQAGSTNTTLVILYFFLAA